MWKSLSLRARLFVPLGIMSATALLVGAVSLSQFGPTRLAGESEPAAHATRVAADALNSALRTSANPRASLEAFVQALGTSETIQFRPAGDDRPPPAFVELRKPLGWVPRWFVNFVATSQIGASFPVAIGTEKVGDLVFAPDISVDIFEKWIGFVAIVSSTLVLTALTGVIAYFAVGSALGRLSLDNRKLLHKIVSLRDDERRDLARDLHDELGPLLFGIRANAVALIEAVSPEDKTTAAAAEGVLQSVEALQQANRRVLDRLRPLYIEELGLERSILTLLQNACAHAPALKLSSRFGPELNDLDGVPARTVYRVIQEGVTNVLRHASAHEMTVEAGIKDRQLVVEIADDGVGFPRDLTFGRGLTGMQERVRALSGTLELLRAGGRTRVRCYLPVAKPT
jgi:two-component system sensor histidine kinase UhpB